MNHFTGWVLLLLGSTLILLTISLLLRRGLGPAERYGTPARFFLVLLRLAIGWHCLIEGLEKQHTPGWTGEPYLREAYGPLSGFYRDLVGDRLADRLTVTTDGELPPRLSVEWDAYEANFADHYGLDAEQRERADDKLRQAKKDTASWFASQREATLRPAVYPPELKVPMTVAERLQMAERLQERVAVAEADLPSSDPDLQKRWKDAKADLNKWRAGLKKSLDAQTDKMKEKLRDVLTDAQKAQAPPPAVLPMESWQLLDWSDYLVMWGLIVLGTLLLLGLFSRLASAATALLVLSFYLALPPLPGWPESPRLEGHYLLVNKTFIEVLALGALAFIPTGRWLGLDALLSCFLPTRRAKNVIVTEAARPTATSRPVQPVG